MLHGSTSPDVGASELTRLLARLGGAASAGSRPVFAERLSHWLGWTGAISLASALNDAPSPPARAPGRLRTHDTEAAEFQRVQAVLEAGIAAGPRERSSADADLIDFGPCRRHCIARQHAMEDAVGALRLRLREALSRSSPAGARLAAIDAVMQRTLTPQERSLLGLVPLRLQAHFDRLQRAGADNPGWPQAFRDDMDRVLRAELAHRLLPAHGLLEALRTHRPTR